jgi:hypothetical protein
LYLEATFSVVLTYVESSAIAAGVPENFAFYLIAMSNAASGPGRVIGGLAADKYGLRFYGSSSSKVLNIW